MQLSYPSLKRSSLKLDQNIHIKTIYHKSNLNSQELKFYTLICIYFLLEYQFIYTFYLGLKRAHSWNYQFREKSSVNMKKMEVVFNIFLY